MGGKEVWVGRPRVREELVVGSSTISYQSLLRH